MTIIARCPWTTVLDVEEEYGNFANYVDAMQTKCGEEIGRKPAIISVTEDPGTEPRRIQLVFEWIPLATIRRMQESYRRKRAVEGKKH